MLLCSSCCRSCLLIFLLVQHQFFPCFTRYCEMILSTTKTARTRAMRKGKAIIAAHLC